MKINSLEFKSIASELNIEFKKFCTLDLIPNRNGVFFYSPQGNYKYVKNYAYLEDVDENTIFCKFKPDLPKIKGVYLWVSDNEIIYIGEGVNLRSRFNSGYGNISPRNCFKGGQSTNVKMNRIALSYLKNNRPIDIYIYETANHKELETLLLSRISTQYNKQNN